MITTKLRTNIADGIREANEILGQDSEFMEWYTSPEFIEFIPDMSNGDFLKFMLVLNTWIQVHDVEVKLWRPWAWRFSGAIAMTKGRHIHLNKYRLNRDVCSIVGSICHELAHIVDGVFSANKFWHGNNYREGERCDFKPAKRRTTPYLFGEIARDYIKNGRLYTVDELIHFPQEWE